jgi:hypothetical protein
MVILNGENIYEEGVISRVVTATSNRGYVSAAPRVSKGKKLIACLDGTVHIVDDTIKA